MADEIPRQLAENLAAFRTAQAVADYSFYRLFAEELYLYPKFYKPGDTVLDLACGLGRTTLLLHEMGLHVRGVDRSDVFIETAKRRLPYLDLRVGSYEQIEEKDCSYDHVLISFNGIDFAYPESQREVALRECLRVLKPGGTFIYSSHNLKSMHWYSPHYRDRLRWKLSYSVPAFREWAYVKEEGIHTFYASPEFVIRQTEALGAKLVEKRELANRRFRNLVKRFAPYIYYVFEKPRD